MTTYHALIAGTVTRNVANLAHSAGFMHWWNSGAPLVIVPAALLILGLLARRRPGSGS